jgi:hypothetical protein
MTDTLYADVSEFQVEVNNTYPYRFFAFRSNDGTYRDHHFANNLAWAKHACDTGKLTGFIVYFVYETNWRQTLATFQAMVGKPHPKMAVMIDVESWGGKIRGDQSSELNALDSALRGWLRKYTTARDWAAGRWPYKRILGYANAYDFASLWPKRRSTLRTVLANYTSNPPFPGKVAHQFSDHFHVPPFGYCDINSADGYTPAALARKLGLPTSSPAPAPAPKPAPAPAPKPAPAPVQKTYTVRSGDTLSSIATRFHTTVNAILKVNPKITNPNVISVGQVINLP